MIYLTSLCSISKHKSPNPVVSSPKLISQVVLWLLTDVALLAASACLVVGSWKRRPNLILAWLIFGMLYAALNFAMACYYIHRVNKWMGNG